jgi:hypothetical protein
VIFSVLAEPLAGLWQDLFRHYNTNSQNFTLNIFLMR